MKKFIICAAAAIVALASCSKTQVVYNDAPEEINFKAVSGVMTKEPILDGYFPTTQSMNVYAWNNSGKVAYFDNEVFSHNGTTWISNPAQYYPTTGSLDFVAYTNNSSMITLSSVTNDYYTYTLADNSETQHDFMVSNYVVNNSKSGDPVAINFSHALALVEVNVACSGQSVTVNSVSLSGTKQEGSVTVTYTGADNANTNVAPTFAVWDVTSAPDKEMTKTADNFNVIAGASVVNFANFLVVPETGSDKTLTINYTLNGNTFNHPITLSGFTGATSWAVGKKYIFNVTIGLQAITFSPTITDWVTGATTTPSI